MIKTHFITRFLSDQSGLAAEFALVLPVLLIFTVGAMDVGMYAWRLNQVEKATQMGARFAIVTDPVAEEILTESYVNTTVGTTTITQGDRIPAGALGKVTCTSTACTCATAPCPTTITRDATAFDALAERITSIAPFIEDADIEIDYSGSGLGFAGDPNGPDLAPFVTVRVTDQDYTPLTWALFGGTIGLGDFSYTMTAEDSSGTSSN